MTQRPLANVLGLSAREYGPWGRLVLYIAVRRVHVKSVLECSSVPYTNKSLVFLWLTILGLFALTASGTVARPWLLLLLLVALVAPALILRNQDPVPAIARSRTRPRIAPTRDQSLLDLSAMDVYQWENEGGAAAHEGVG